MTSAPSSHMSGALPAAIAGPIFLATSRPVHSTSTLMPVSAVNWVIAAWMTLACGSS